MSCSVITGSWIFVLCVLMGFALFAHLAFLRFCKSVAALQGRMADYESIAGSDEDGNNDFVREQLARLYDAKFDDIDDENLVTLGWDVRRRLGFQIIGVILLIATAVWIQSIGCF